MPLSIVLTIRSTNNCLIMFRKLVLLSCLLAVYAQRRYPGQYDGRPIDREYPPRPYSFSYVAPAIGGSSSRQESGDASGKITGSYSLSDEDGRSRIVNYIADEGGFRATVETNEPGTDNKNPADVIFYSNAPAVNYNAAPLAPVRNSARTRTLPSGAAGRVIGGATNVRSVSGSPYLPVASVPQRVFADGSGRY